MSTYAIKELVKFSISFKLFLVSLCVCSAFVGFFIGYIFLPVIEVEKQSGTEESYQEDIVSVTANSNSFIQPYDYVNSIGLYRPEKNLSHYIINTYGRFDPSDNKLLSQPVFVIEDGFAVLNGRVFTKIEIDNFDPSIAFKEFVRVGNYLKSETHLVYLGAPAGLVENVKSNSFRLLEGDFATDGDFVILGRNKFENLKPDEVTFETLKPEQSENEYLIMVTDDGDVWLPACLGYTVFSKDSPEFEDRYEKFNKYGPC